MEGIHSQGKKKLKTMETNLDVNMIHLRLKRRRGELMLK